MLVHVSEAKEGKIRTSALAEAAGWERSRLSHHLGRMERRGLVTRTACPRDGRGVIVGLTEEGWRTIHAAAPDHVALVRRVFIDALGEEGLRALDHVTTTVLAALEAEEPESR